MQFCLKAHHLLRDQADASSQFGHDAIFHSKVNLAIEGRDADGGYNPGKLTVH